MESDPQHLHLPQQEVVPQPGHIPEPEQSNQPDRAAVEGNVAEYVGTIIGQLERLGDEATEARIALFALAKLALDRDAAAREAFDRATTDTLTGLPNRTALMARENWHVQHKRVERDTEQRIVDVVRPEAFACLYGDLDGFKAVNDGLGHDEGDRVLIVAANALRYAVREDDEIYRLGGDEFVMFVPLYLLDAPEGQEPVDHEAVTERFRNNIGRYVTERFDTNIQRILAGEGQDMLPDGFVLSATDKLALRSIGMSIGSVVQDGPDLNRIEMMRAADPVMYAIKKARKERAKKA